MTRLYFMVSSVISRATCLRGTHSSSGAHFVENLMPWLFRMHSANEQLAGGPNEYPKVQPKAPIADVPKVQLHPPLHWRQGWCFTAKAIDLSPPGYSGLHVVATRITQISFLY